MYHILNPSRRERVPESCFDIVFKRPVKSALSAGVESARFKRAPTLDALVSEGKRQSRIKGCLKSRS